MFTPGWENPRFTIPPLTIPPLSFPQEEMGHRRTFDARVSKATAAALAAVEDPGGRESGRLRRPRELRASARAPSALRPLGSSWQTSEGSPRNPGSGEPPRDVSTSTRV